MTSYIQPDKIQYSVLVETNPDVVWEILTETEYMKHWMGESEMNIDIETSWNAGEPIIIRGFHHVHFENKGTILAFEPKTHIRYNHLSSISRLPDVPENYSVVEFRLAPVDGNTSLTLILENFPTESIKQHLEFYWKTTLNIIKRQAEDHKISIPNDNQ